jgi:DnaK suppressor protein
MTTTRSAPAESRARRARHRGLQAMLRAGQRDMQDVLRRRVRRVAHGGSEDVVDDTEQVEAGVQDDLDAALIQMKRDTLERVQEALGHLDAGLDGRCVVCDRKIGDRRLLVQPFAVRCTACQETHEGRTEGPRAWRDPGESEER